MIVLSRGHTIYSGLTDNCLSHLEKSGFPIPLFVNPFEFILDVSSQCRNHTCNTSDQLDLIDAARQLWSNYDKVPAQTTVTIEKQRSEQNSRLVDLSPKSKRYERLCTVLSRSLTLTGRTWICTVRDRLGVSCSILEAIIMGTLSGCMFYHVGKDLPGIKSRIGAMHTAAGLQSYLVLIFETYRLSIDSQIFDREREEGVSIPLTFVLSRRLSRMFLEDIPVPLIYSTIFYFTAGFRHEIDTFLIFFTIQYLLHVMAVSVAVFCVALNRNFLIASLAANTIFVMQTMAAGFFVNLGDVSLWLRWMKWTSYLVYCRSIDDPRDLADKSQFYAFGALCYNEFSDQLYECPVPSMESNTAACAPYSGKVILESLNIPPDWLWRPIVALMALISVVLALSILALHLTHIDKKTTPKVNHNDPELHEHTSPIEPGWTKRRIRVALHRVHLRRTKTYFWSKHGTQKDLVVDVSAEFESAQLHVIMGPSGSGKTTLLNFMAQRSENSSGDNCLVSGTITFDGHKISDSALKSICAYVPQENETMLPTLTVRETLRYAARMRLPQHVPRCEQYKRVERLISSFGLQDCANTMIGDEFTKGISGGEKKRLTIATYVLADPAVLLLDEPTSGLDSATASSIIRMLQSFAKEGRTIIMSIHQPRSEWLGVFKSTLLLKQSGQVMYSGQTASMLDHFQALGFVCPTFQNPADFFLDVTSQEYSNSTSRAAYVESRNHDAGRCPIPTIVDYHSNTIAHAAHFGQLEHHTLNFRIALPLLLHRGVIHLKRQRMIAIGRILQIVGLAIVLTCFFTPLKNGSTSIQSRIGYVQQLGSLFFVGMLNAISIFPTERDLFFREQGDGLYRLEAFVTAYTILEVPSQVMGAILFSMLTVLAVGFPRTIHLLAIVALNAMCVVSCGESLGIALLSIVSHTGLAVTVCCIIMSIFVHITGIIAISMPLFLKAINYVSPLKWMVGNVASFSLRDITFTCGESERLPDGKCPIERGIQVLDLYDLNVDGGKYLWILVALTLGYRFAAYGVLKVKIGSRTPWTTAISKLSSGSATSR